MQINTFSLVYSDKVILCNFIPVKIIGQILTWLPHLAMCSNTLRKLQNDVLNAISYILEQLCFAHDWLLGCVKGIAPNIEKLASWHIIEPRYFFSILVHLCCIPTM